MTTLGTEAASDRFQYVEEERKDQHFLFGLTILVEQLTQACNFADRPPPLPSVAVRRIAIMFLARTAGFLKVPLSPGERSIHSSFSIFSGNSRSTSSSIAAQVKWRHRLVKTLTLQTKTGEARVDKPELWHHLRLEEAN